MEAQGFGESRSSTSRVACPLQPPTSPRSISRVPHPLSASWALWEAAQLPVPSSGWLSPRRGLKRNETNFLSFHKWSRGDPVSGWHHAGKGRAGQNPHPGPPVWRPDALPREAVTGTFGLCQASRATPHPSLRICGLSSVGRDRDTSLRERGKGPWRGELGATGNRARLRHRRQWGSRSNPGLSAR